LYSAGYHDWLAPGVIVDQIGFSGHDPSSAESGSSLAGGGGGGDSIDNATAKGFWFQLFFSTSVSILPIDRISIAVTLHLQSSHTYHQVSVPTQQLMYMFLL